MNDEITYHINTGMGKVFDKNSLPFLSSDEFDEFNKIGYTGSNNKGERTNYEDFLNTLGKGIFSVIITKFDNGDFSESFEITCKDSIDIRRRKKLNKILKKISDEKNNLSN